MCFITLRMLNGGSGWVFMFVLALTFSTYPALGILKKTCPVPSSVHCPIVFHFPLWWKWKRNWHKHPIVNYEICTGNWKFSQNRPGCVMARRCVAGRVHRSLSGFRGVSCTSVEVLRRLALGFFHYTHVMLLVWFTQYALAAFAGFCGSNSAVQAQTQTLPDLHSKYNMHEEEETSINNLFSSVKDDTVLRCLVQLHYVT